MIYIDIDMPSYFASRLVASPQYLSDALDQFFLTYDLLSIG